MEIISRKDWGAKAPRSTQAVAWKNRTGFVIHHTTGSNLGREDSAAWLRAIQDYHMVTRGWNDIGYNLAVDREGLIFDLRGWTRLGAHVAGHNTANVGVVLLGDATRADNVTPAAKRALVWLSREADRRAGRMLTVRGHGDLAATTCPGLLRAWINLGMPVTDAPGPGTPPAGGLALAAKPVLRSQAVRHTPGSRLDTETRRVQAELAYVHGLISVGPIDGWFGDRTGQAVRELQKRRGAKLIDGIVGPETWRLLLG